MRSHITLKCYSQALTFAALDVVAISPSLWPSSPPERFPEFCPKLCGLRAFKGEMPFWSQAMEFLSVQRDAEPIE
jgi:hypothetical protein